MEAKDGASVKFFPATVVAASSSPSFRVPADGLSFRMPSLCCSFPSLLHPEYEVVREQCDEWILGVARPPSAAARQFLVDCMLPRLLCRNIPNGNLQKMIHVTKIISWLIISDDDDDHPDAFGSDYSACSQRADSILAILRKGDIHGEETQRNRHQFDNSPSNATRKRRAGVETLAEVWEETRKDMPAGLRARFTTTMADYLDGVKAQAAFRSVRHLPDVDAFMDIRRQASFIMPGFVLAEYALGIYLDESTYANPLITQLRNAALDYMCLCNDLLSCRVESAAGDYFNLPSIVYNAADSACATFQDAVDRVARMTEDLDALCIYLVTAIQNSPDPVLQQPCVRTYLGTLSSCMSGSLAWSLETARYRNLVIDPTT